MADKRILVTGGAGVIGTELLKKLARTEAKILSVDRLPLKEKIDGITHLQKDLAIDNIEELAEFRPQVIFHLAAAFERSKESPNFWTVNWHDNVTASHRVVDLTRRLVDPEVFIFASSYLIYSPTLYLKAGPAKPRLLTESDLQNPRNITGTAKLYTEKELEFVKEYYHNSLRIVNARIFRVYGFRSKDVISRWIRAALGGEEIEVYNKENMFDYIHAQDVAEGLLRLASSPEANGVINLGSGTSRRVEEALNIIDRHIPIANRIRELGTVEKFEASGAEIANLAKMTNWTPPTRLEDGIRSVIDFEQKEMSRGTG